MAVFSVSRAAPLFIPVDSRRRLSLNFSRMNHDVDSMASFPIIYHSSSLPHGRRSKRNRKMEEVQGGCLDLEPEIFKFMDGSADPMRFPSREVLIAAGREDLVTAILKEGGWLAYGWGSNEEEYCGTDCTDSEWVEEFHRIFHNRVNSIAGGASRSSKADLEIFRGSSDDSSRVSTSGRIIMGHEEYHDGGIEGILNRLEKERSIAFGSISAKKREETVEKEVGLSKITVTNGYVNGDGCNESSNGRHLSSYLGEGVNAHPTVYNSHSCSLTDRNSDPEPATWRTWNLQRSGDTLTNFEAAETILEDDRLIEMEKVSSLKVRDTSGINNGRNCPYDNDQGSLKDDILDSQTISSALQLLRFRSNDSLSSSKDSGQEGLLNQLHKLTDALEFRQKEIKNARDILRSTRAKLAVLEGKIGLEIIDSQKNIEGKQRKLAAERSLSVLRSVYIVWPNSASQVLLVGSFDGWTTQRRMESNNLGVFFLTLKLYPGRYEIKFIADGVWGVDPLRPIVNSNGFENNVLIVT